MPRKILVLLFITSVYADVSDLEALIKELEQKPIQMQPIILPKLSFDTDNYKDILKNNVFDSGRNTNYDISGLMYNQDYSLGQLKMVGYMNYNGVDYAFLKTPFDTIKVKVGDQIKGSKVVNITNSVVELNQLQIINDKSYNKKIFIELVQPVNNKAK